MPDKRMVILQIDGQNSQGELRKKYDDIWNPAKEVSRGDTEENTMKAMQRHIGAEEMQ